MLQVLSLRRAKKKEKKEKKIYIKFQRLISPYYHCPELNTMRHEDFVTFVTNLFHLLKKKKFFFG